MWEELEIDPNEPKNEDAEKSFRSRVLGLFYEPLLSIGFRRIGYCCASGRPSCYTKPDGKKRQFTYDYALRKDEELIIVEAKVWPAYERGKWKRLTVERIEKLVVDKTQTAFAEFVKPCFLQSYIFKLDMGSGAKIPIQPTSKALAWWHCDDATKEQVKSKFGFHEIFSVRSILEQLRDSKGKEHDDYLKLVERRRKWTQGLWDSLLKTG
jgi:hypothetical protein